MFADAGVSSIEVSGNWNTTGLNNFYTTSGFGTNSTFGNPNFLDENNGDFHIPSNSPAINAGNPSYTIQAGEVDLDGESRINTSVIDCGADEYYSTSGNSSFRADP